MDIFTISYFGSHDSTSDFPILPDKKAKYSTESANCYWLNFGDISYQIPEILLHYLDDAESIGWEHGWKPPQHFIDRVMRGDGPGEVPPGLVKMSNYGMKGVDEDPLPVPLGYLTYGVGEYAGQIVDTHGGDAHMADATPAEFGPVPPTFLTRMREIIAHIEKDKFGPSPLALPPIENYQDKPTHLPADYKKRTPDSLIVKGPGNTTDFEQAL